jgi:hypothetical protein
MKTIHQYIVEQKVDIDMKVFDELHPYVLADGWVYLKDEMVTDWMGYKRTRVTMSHFYRRLQKEYRDAIDYREVLNSHELVLLPERKETRGGSLRKYFLITPDALMNMLITARTAKGARTAAHFVQVYKLMLKYYKYQCDVLQQDFQAQLAELRTADHIKAHTKAKTFEELEASLAQRHRLGVVYFVYEETKDENTQAAMPFKIGCTFNLPRRLEKLQCSTWRPLRVYKTIITQYPQVLEQMLHDHFRAEHLLNEWFLISRVDIDLA